MSVNGEKHRISFPLCRWLTVAALAVAVAALIAEFGFRVAPLSSKYLHIAQVIAAVLFCGNKIYIWLVLQHREFRWHKQVLDIILLLLLFLCLLFLPGILGASCSASVVRWGVFHVYLLIIVLLYLGRLSVAATASGSAPTRILLISFALIIFTGAILLMLPSAHRGGPLAFTDAVFTATSATCVTGLVVRDTGSDFTILGQSIILFMMQIGGLGIMIFGTLFALLLGSPLSLRESVAMRDIMNEQTPGRIGRIVVFICLTTLAFELLGVIGLYGLWCGTTESTGVAQNGYLYKSIFHSVSAFCNAGFSLQSESMTSYRNSWRIYLVLCPLIVLGGLGFPVLNNLWNVICYRLFRRYRTTSAKQTSSIVRLSLHSKIVLTTTAVLLLAGCVFLVVLEWSRPDRPDGVVASLTGGALLDGLFNSITARTAGFNTIAIEKLSAASKLVLIFLMSIGGSPSSTAGGIKTVTFAVMVMSVYATMRRRSQVHIFRRTIPMMIVRRVSTLIMLYGLLLWFLTLLLVITEHSAGRDMLDLFFEVASALGTVGLSTGVTDHLTCSGKWVIIAVMFVGRLGPLSLLAALTFNARPIRYDYPREPLVVG